MEVTIELVGHKQQWIFSKPEVRLGREADNDVRVSGDAFDMVSRHHAVLRLEDSGCYVEDANSPNGTFLNGKQVERAKVFPADVVRLGKDGPELKVRFVEAGANNAVTLAGPLAERLRIPVPSIGKPAVPPHAEGLANADIAMLEQKVDGLRKLLSATLVLVAVLTTIIVYQGYMISRTQDTVVEMRRQAVDAVAMFTPALDHKIADFQKRTDDMQAVVSGFDAKIKGAEDEFVQRMNRELPATLDRYIEQKLDEVKGTGRRPSR